MCCEQQTESQTELVHFPVGPDILLRSSLRATTCGIQEMLGYAPLMCQDRTLTLDYRGKHSLPLFNLFVIPHDKVKLACFSLSSSLPFSLSPFFFYSFLASYKEGKLNLIARKTEDLAKRRAIKT